MQIGITRYNTERRARAGAAAAPLLLHAASAVAAAESLSSSIRHSAVRARQELSDALGMLFCAGSDARP